MLRIRKLADRSVRRITRYDPDTGEKYLVNPENGQREGYPLVGVKFEGAPPKKVRVGQDYLLNAEREGWVTVEDKEIVQRTAGPPEEPVSPEVPPHVFVHGSAVVFHTVDGDVRFKVTRCPDKWPKKKDKAHPLEAGFGGEVDWTFHLKLEA